MTDQEFSNHAVKVIASLGLIFMLVIGFAYFVVPKGKPIEKSEYVSYDYQLMMMYSDVHRAVILKK